MALFLGGAKELEVVGTGKSGMLPTDDTVWRVELSEGDEILYSSIFSCGLSGIAEREVKTGVGCCGLDWSSIDGILLWLGLGGLWGICDFGDDG